MAGPPGLAIFVLVTPTHPFLYRQAASEDDAAQQLAQAGAVALGGGTDLLVTIAEEISLPDLVVDLRTIPGAVGISPTADGGIRIGAATRVSDIASDPVVRDQFAALVSCVQRRGHTGAPAHGHAGRQPLPASSLLVLPTRDLVPEERGSPVSSGRRREPVPRDPRGRSLPHRASVGPGCGSSSARCCR